MAEVTRTILLPELALAEGLIAVHAEIDRMLYSLEPWNGVEVPKMNRMTWSLMRGDIFNTCNHLDTYAHDRVAEYFMKNYHRPGALTK